MTSFVLVHGAFGGSYGFRKVRRLLAGEGHDVVTPDLLGSPGAAMAASAQDGFVAPIGRDLGDDEANAWMQARRVPQPVKTLTDPVSLSKPVEDWDVGLTFIKATEDPPEPSDSPFWQAYREAAASPRWTAHGINCNHMIPELRPEQLVSLLPGRS